jgi:hypothetical protein
MSLATFTQELDRLVSNFDRNKAFYSSKDFQESQLRVDFVSPLFEALGWDVSNRAGNPPHLREVVVESRVEEKGHRRRADYTFQVSGQPRLVVETKRPSEDLEDPKHILQLKKYAWNLQVRFAVLTNFLQTKIYAVPAPPVFTQPNEFLLEQVEFLQYLAKPDLLYGLLSKERVLEGALDKYFETIPKHKRDKAYQRSLFRLRGSKMVDDHFLDDLMEFRRDLARDIVLRNPKSGLSEPEVNEAVQRVIDRIVFLRIGEDRGIIYDPTLLDLVEKWGSKGSRVSFYPRLVEHFAGFNRPYNGLLFKRHPLSEDLDLSDEVLAGFIERISVETSPYRFDVIPVEILGSIYERFLGSVVRITPARVKVEEKPEVRKAGGVYYTPKYIVDYIVSQTVGKLLEGRTPEQVTLLKVLDPACGSGSFLLGAFTRIMEYLVEWFHRNPRASGKYGEWFYLDETGSVRLTPYAKRRILLNNLFGVDIDPQACEVTQLSLYLKLLEGESAASLREHQLKAHAEAFLPDLRNNIKCGNSLVGTEFEQDVQTDLLGDKERKRVVGFDWKAEYPGVMKVGGFDCVIGNPPYLMVQPHNTAEEILSYFRSYYVAADFKIDLFHLFLQRGVSLIKKAGYLGFILPTTILNNVYVASLRSWITGRCCIEQIVVARGRVFADADVHTSVVVLRSEPSAAIREKHKVLTTIDLGQEFASNPIFSSRTKQSIFAELPGGVWNILVNDQNAGLMKKLTHAFLPLGKVATINRGLITGDRDKYFSHKKLSADYVPIITGSDVQRYYTAPPSEYILFKRPKTAGGCWDQEVHFAPHKVVVRQICERPTASIIRTPLAVTGNIFTVIAKSLEEELYLLGIINSRLSEFFWKIMFADFKTSFPQVTIFSLEQLPIHQIELSKRSGKVKHDKMIRLVERMLGLHKELAKAKSDNDKTLLQRQISSTDRQINTLVYDLYGLTKDEIKLIEESYS